MKKGTRWSLVSMALIAALIAWSVRADPTELDSEVAAVAPSEDPADTVKRLGPRPELTKPMVRTSLSLPEPSLAAGDEPAEPPIPPTAVVLRLLRWPDRTPLPSGTPIQVVESGQGSVRHLASPASARLRLADGLAERPAPVFVRAQGFEPLRVEGEAIGKGIVYVALLRPTQGWYGRVVDGNGKPLKGVPVGGFWVEDQRPTTGVSPEQVLSASVHKRLAPPEEGSSVSTASVTDSGTIVQLLDDTTVEPTAAAVKRWKKALERRRRTGKDSDTTAPVFLGAHGPVESTAKTDEDGWYYIEPLEGFVLGTLTLLAERTKGASDVLRVAIPSTQGRLPRLVVHRPRPVTVRVVDETGAPIEGAQVLHSLAGGWSPEWGPNPTDESGVVTLDAPFSDIWIAVEKVGYGLAEPQSWRPASADRLWSNLVEMCSSRSRAKGFFRDAYSSWKSAFPRARGFQTVPFSATDAKVVMASQGVLVYEVKDAQSDFPLPNTLVRVEYGGLAPESQRHYTALDGVVAVPLSDREWQPMLVNFRAPGYRELTLAIPPTLSKYLPVPIPIKLVEESAPDPEGSEETEANGRVIATGRDHSATLVLRAGGPQNNNGKRLWSRTSDAKGDFLYSQGGAPEGASLFLYGLAVDARTDLPVSGISMGPFTGLSPTRRDPLLVQLEPGIPFRVTLDLLEPNRPYRLDWSLSPHFFAGPVAKGSYQLPLTHGVRMDVEVPVPQGWVVRLRVFGAAIGHGPSFAFTKDRRPDERLFLSTKPTWESWQPATGIGEEQVVLPGRRMYLRVVRRAMLAGVVNGLPYYPEPRVVQMAAMGSLGTWYSNLTGNGWFEFPNLPLDEYRLVLYERPSSVDGPAVPHAQGQIRSRSSVMLSGDRFDVKVDWPKPPEEDEDQQAEGED